LLDPSKDRDPDVNPGTEKRSNLHVVQGALKEERDPGREAGLVQNRVDPRVVYTVKSFGSVEKENKAREPFYYAFKEKLVDVYRVFSAIAAPKKAFLGGVDKLEGSWHNGMGDHARQQAIVCVGNADRAGV
jgi:hypothetical protein